MGILAWEPVWGCDQQVPLQTLIPMLVCNVDWALAWSEITLNIPAHYFSSLIGCMTIKLISPNTDIEITIQMNFTILIFTSTNAQLLLLRFFIFFSSASSVQLFSTDYSAQLLQPSPFSSASSDQLIQLLQLSFFRLDYSASLDQLL